MVDTCTIFRQTSSPQGMDHLGEFSVMTKTYNVFSFDTLQLPFEEVNTEREKQGLFIRHLVNSLGNLLSLFTEKFITI